MPRLLRELIPAIRHNSGTNTELSGADSGMQ
jgi:hypothetical protein